MIEDSNPYGALQCSLYAQAQSGSPQPHGPHSPSAKATLDVCSSPTPTMIPLTIGPLPLLFPLPDTFYPSFRSQLPQVLPDLPTRSHPSNMHSRKNIFLVLLPLICHNIFKCVYTYMALLMISIASLV